MKKTLLLLTSFVMFLGLNSTIGQTTFFDNFEAYNVGDFVAATNSDWTTWGNSPGSAEDTQVSDEQAFSGDKSAKFLAGSADGPTDLVLPFGGKYETGRFLFETQMYITSGTGAYFNFQSEETIGITWCMQVWFYDDGTYAISNSDNQAVFEGTYPGDQWFKLTYDIDLTLNNWEVKIDDQSLGTFSNPENAVASMDIYPLAGNIFYMDDVSFEHTPFVMKNFDIAVTQVALPPKGLIGKEYAPTAQIRNIGMEAITAFDVTWTDGTNSETKSIDGLNVPSFGFYDINFDELYTADAANNVITITVENPNGMTDDDPSNNVKSIEMEIIVPADDKVMYVEEATGTWCAWCPRGAVWMERMAHDYGNYFADF